MLHFAEFPMYLPCITAKSKNHSNKKNEKSSWQNSKYRILDILLEVTWWLPRPVLAVLEHVSSHLKLHFPSEVFSNFELRDVDEISILEFETTKFSFLKLQFGDYEGFPTPRSGLPNTQKCKKHFWKVVFVWNTRYPIFEILKFIMMNFRFFHVWFCW